jgi:hypothetical protein
MGDDDKVLAALARLDAKDDATRTAIDETRTALTDRQEMLEAHVEVLHNEVRNLSTASVRQSNDIESLRSQTQASMRAPMPTLDEINIPRDKQPTAMRSIRVTERKVTISFWVNVVLTILAIAAPIAVAYFQYRK